MSKAKNESTSKLASKETPNQQELLAQAQKELEAASNQLSGLQTFLKALGESANSSVMNINDLTFGFGYLLDAAEMTVKLAKEFVERAKGGDE